jgi:hypothetical protein
MQKRISCSCCQRYGLLLSCNIKIGCITDVKYSGAGVELYEQVTSAIGKFSLNLNKDS